MKTFIEPCSETVYEGPLWMLYFDGMNIGVLDIETTGLNPQWSEAYWEAFINTERANFFSSSLRTEHGRRNSEAFISEIAELDAVITYNGKYFDIPFLEQRLRFHGPPVMKKKYMNLDLYRVISGHSPLKSLLPNLKQKTVENYMGLWSSREDEISGAESAELYKHYEATADESRSVRFCSTIKTMGAGKPFLQKL